MPNATSLSSSVGVVLTGFKLPKGIAVDNQGNIYVADTENNRIQKFDSTGNLLQTIGLLGSGIGQFENPEGLAIDSTGNILVADSGNDRVEVYDSQGNFVAHIKFKKPGTSTDVPYHPNSIAVSSSGRIYVTDPYNSIIDEFDHSGTHYSYVGRFANSTDLLHEPTAVAVDLSGNIYVADSFENSVYKFNSYGSYLTTVIASSHLLNKPLGLSVDKNYNIFVSDSGNNKIRMFDSNGNEVASAGGSGISSAQLNAPGGLAVDGFGNVFVADTHNYRVQEFLNSGITTTPPLGNSLSNSPPIIFHKTQLSLLVRDGTQLGNIQVFPELKDDYGNYLMANDIKIAVNGDNSDVASVTSNKWSGDIWAGTWGGNGTIAAIYYEKHDAKNINVVYEGSRSNAVYYTATMPTYHHQTQLTLQIRDGIIPGNIQVYPVLKDDHDNPITFLGISISVDGKNFTCDAAMVESSLQFCKRINDPALFSTNIWSGDIWAGSGTHDIGAFVSQAQGIDGRGIITIYERSNQIIPYTISDNIQTNNVSNDAISSNSGNIILVITVLSVGVVGVMIVILARRKKDRNKNPQDNLE